MSLQLEITNIMHKIIKNYYYNYLNKHKRLLISNDHLRTLVEEYYDNEKDILKKQIREQLKTNASTTFDKLSIENMIFEIFSDKEFAINKIVRDIINYQNNKLIKTTIEYKNDLGLKVDINEYGVCISNILNKSIDQNMINVGDYIINMNNQNLLALEHEKQIEILQNLKHNVQNNMLDIHVYKNS